MYCLNCHHPLTAYAESCPGCGVYLPHLVRDFLPLGAHLQPGRYRISHYLGRGGFGLTYAAQDISLERRVAIKEFFLDQHMTRLPDQHTAHITSGVPAGSNRTDFLESSLQRFLREGRILARLNHAHIVRVLDFFRENETAYLVMEHLQGETLAQYQAERGPLPAAEVQQFASELVSALAAAHAQGVYHLDLKPENIFKTEQGLKLIDFGSARTAQARHNTQYTLTEAYAAPELLMPLGVKAGAYSDLYELGMVLYQWLTGRRPPDWNQQPFLDPVPLDLPEPWLSLLQAALHFDPSKRPGEITRWWQQAFPPALPLNHASSTAPAALKVCPYCAETIAASAEECYFCAEILVSVAAPAPQQVSQSAPAPLESPPDTAHLFTPITAPALAETIPGPERRVISLSGPDAEAVTLEFVWIAPGTFMMGSPQEELYRDAEESLHPVTLSRGYYLQTTPVTQRQWQAVMGHNPSRFRGEELPVENLSWHDCQAFVACLNALGAGVYRLPTEAEWEYACRAGTTTPFSHGHELNRTQANFNDRLTRPDGLRKRTTPVKSFRPNARGLYDMHGNVWEWCQDGYGPYPTGAVVDPQGLPSSLYRVLRGGSWRNLAGLCRSARRRTLPPEGAPLTVEGHNGDQGVRLVWLP
jgi:formylglycine-generating enzyme required for sulfatase activity